MPEIISRKVFCEMTGVSAKHISMYANRDKIKLEPDGQIDIALSMNQDFIKSRNKKKSTVKSLAKPAVKPEVKKEEVKKEVVTIVEVNSDDTTYEQKRKVELELKKRDLMMKDVQLQKMNGEVIPTELVGVMIRYHVRQLQMELKNSFERVVSDLIIKMNGSREEIGKMRKLITETINASSDKARDGMNDQLERIVDDYRKSKGK